MGGHHAFNYPDKEVYWKDQTVQYHHEFVTNILGVKSEDRNVQGRRMDRRRATLDQM